MAPRILPNVMLERPAAIIQKHLERKGVMFHLSDSVAPVSYTHLDVYKRQVHARHDGIQNSFQFLANEHGHDCRRCFVCTQAVVIAGRRNRNTQQVLVFVHGLDDRGQKPVSYTHLDVYKRQGVCA